MSGNASIITPFVARPGVPESAWLLLEQQPYSNDIGKVTMLDIVQALSGKILGNNDAASIDCGIAADGHSFATLAYVYPYPESLPYQVGMTHGNFSKIGRTVVQMTETLSFSIDTSASLKYPVRQLLSTKWLAEVWSADGLIVAPPVIARQGQDVQISNPVYGSLSVTYTTLRDIYRLSITARETAVENVFQSVLYAYFDGGIKMLEVDAPENAEDNFINGTDCTGTSATGDTFFGDGEDEEEPTVDPKNIEIILDYCEDFGND